jgi:hypothetical protein
MSLIKNFSHQKHKNSEKPKKYSTVRIILKSIIKIEERGKIDTTNTYIHDRSLSWLDASFLDFDN